MLSASLLVGPPAVAADLVFNEGVAPCPQSAASRLYSIAAIRIPIVYNNWGDLDPHGRLFVRLTDVDDVLQAVEDSFADATMDQSIAMFPLTTAALADARVNFVANQLPASAAAMVEIEAAFYQDQANVNAYLEAHPNVSIDLPKASEEVQPLVIRSRLGECVKITLTNLLPEVASLHVHGAYTAAGQGMALGGLQNDLESELTLPGAQNTYVTWVPNWTSLEGAHYFHSHADSRYQTKHGLFGALVTEPWDSAWKASDTGVTAHSGQEAIIDRGASGGSDFREHVLFYHDEVELYGLSLGTEPTDTPLIGAKPVVSQYFEYGPGTKAINLRSEPFMNRFKHHDALANADEALPEIDQLSREHDKSMGYSSYAYGDPGVFIPKSYVGDPTKFRLVNAGPGQPHVHHLHGGGTRWRVSPAYDDSQFDEGRLKDNNGHAQAASERVDVQNINVGESFNAEIEGGAGGVQGGAGEFLFHCHIAEHYVAGMWSFWRVYDTNQSFLAKLPDRSPAPTAVDSLDLLGEHLPGMAQNVVLTAANAADWLDHHLPPKGEPDDDNDARVWDWRVDLVGGEPLYLAEPETSVTWPNYVPETGLTNDGRPPIMWNPETGKPAFPLLRPHFGQRPPFPPNKSPAPWLGEQESEANESGLCTTRSLETTPVQRQREYDIVAASATIGMTRAMRDDDNGQVYMLADDYANYDEGDPVTSLVIRANHGDCIDVYLTNDLDLEGGKERKVNIHIHLVQFDTQASDGVVTGLSFEQTLRPMDQTSAKIVSIDTMDPSHLYVQNGARLREGTFVGVGLATSDLEPAKVVTLGDEVNGITEVWLDRELSVDHTNELIGAEYAHYRWYADVELGVVYWHDHVDGLNTWRHGLFGSLVVEPEESDWCQSDVTTSCVPAGSGHFADIVTKDENNSFREVVLQFQDSACVARFDLDCLNADPKPTNRTYEFAAFNLRSAPLAERDHENPFSSWGRTPSNAEVYEAALRGTTQGDPMTPLLRAYAGDNLTVRLIYAGQGGTTGVGTFRMGGHRFEFEQRNPDSRLMDSVPFGISSHHNLNLDCGAGGCYRKAGDYMYHMTEPDLLDRGGWGIFRVYGAEQTGTAPLRALPNNQPNGEGEFPDIDWPTTTHRTFDVHVKRGNVLINDQYDVTTEIMYYVNESEVNNARPEPFIGRVTTGMRFRVNVHNDLPTGDDNVTFNIGGLVSTDPLNDGVAISNEAERAIEPGESGAYEFFADKDVGIVHVGSMGYQVDWSAYPVSDAQQSAGLYGAIVVEPSDKTGYNWTGASTALSGPSGTTREHVLIYGSDDRLFQASIMPYHIDVRNHTLVNYRTMSLNRVVGGQDCQQPSGNICPQVPTLESGAKYLGGVGIHSCHIDVNNCGSVSSGAAGVRFEVRNPLNALAFALDTPEIFLPARNDQALVLRALAGGGDQLVTHAVDGKLWAADPNIDDCDTNLSECHSNLVSAVALGVGVGSNAWIPDAGYGGDGDFLWSNHRDAFTEEGAWGLLRVCEPDLAIILMGGVCDMTLATIPGTSEVADAVEDFEALAVQALEDAEQFIEDMWLDPQPPPGVQCESGDVLIAPLGAQSGWTYARYDPFLIPCVIVSYQGTATWVQRDAVSTHDPASMLDEGRGTNRCFWAGSGPGVMEHGAVYSVDFRYNGITKVVESRTNGLLWKTCPDAVDLDQSTSNYGVVPYYCERHGNMLGAVVVYKSGYTGGAPIINLAIN